MTTDPRSFREAVAFETEGTAVKVSSAKQAAHPSLLGCVPRGSACHTWRAAGSFSDSQDGKKGLSLTFVPVPGTEADSVRVEQIREK